ncbi:glycogen debranching enzyme N-terminal domain-containing protein [Candidatus Bathyarchaeota archaeon]|nr:glycogen debranching enzyme N-terminal domain-containing protein [Candidatus Bathyarchaeota archaeon]
MKTPSISIQPETLSRFEESIQKEWIITNGLGGYASSTVLGINTRKYHGLLVAAFHPPSDRRVCLEKLDEEVIIGNNAYRLGANEFQNGIFPQGYSFLREFALSPFPKHVYRVENVEIQKTVFMPHHENAVVVLYKVHNSSDHAVKVRSFPLINLRHFHSVTDRWRSTQPSQAQKERETIISVTAPDAVLALEATNGQYHAEEKWVEDIYYRQEAERGESCLDDCYESGFFEVGIGANGTQSFAVTTAAGESEKTAKDALSKIPAATHELGVLYEKEKERHENYLTKFYEAHSRIPESVWLSSIVLATRMFIVNDLNFRSKAVIAGYHWFEVWGRDAFVSLPGLTLINGKFEDAREVFLSFKKHCRQGLIPNFLPDRLEQPAYNSVDATLWFVNSVLQYLKYTGDFRFVEEQLWETMKSIIDNHVRGTFFDIHVADDGLLSHGPQLTWMDASVNCQPVTPRKGKAVEVQALWYNALRTMELLANKFEEKNDCERYARMAERAKSSFSGKFWNTEMNCLFDAIDEYGKDNSLRPNQIIALALDFTMLDNIKNEKVLDVVKRELLTPYGLRTLARNNPKYVGCYAGDRRSRDEAYHNGTVWPWLLGQFTTAFLKTRGHSEFWREWALKNLLMPLLTEQVFAAGLGVLSEVFDGDSPHAPKGCITQAWSIAEILRAYVEDVMHVKPRYEIEVLHSLR